MIKIKPSWAVTSELVPEEMVHAVILRIYLITNLSIIHVVVYFITAFVPETTKRSFRHSNIFNLKSISVYIRTYLKSSFQAHLTK